MGNETLAAKLGITVHLSPLLRKAQRLVLDAAGLAQLAYQRGQLERCEPLVRYMAEAGRRYEPKHPFG